jgi:hypothetical protein
MRRVHVHVCVRVRVRVPANDCHCGEWPSLSERRSGSTVQCEVVSRQQYDLYSIDRSAIPRMQYVVKSIRLRLREMCGESTGTLRVLYMYK